MKKITIFFILIYCLIPKNTFAESVSSEKCLINDSTSETITNYITDLHNVLKNINSELITQDPDSSIKGSYKKGLKTISSGFYSLTNWDYYKSYFDFYVTYSITDDYVYQIRRDYDLIDGESDGLKKYYKYILKKGYINSSITKEKACNLISSKCNFSGNILDILTQLQGELEYLKNYYRKSILGDKVQFEQSKLSFIGNDFETKFSKSYNSNTTIECSMGTNGFFAKISERVQNIIDWNKMSENGIKEMKEAIALAKGEGYGGKTYEEIEKELLKKELSRQGLDSNQAQVMLNNLDKYNSGGITKDNNFFTNSFNYVYDGISSQLNSFSGEVLSTFNQDSNTNSVTLGNFNTKSKENDIGEEISKEISLIYKTEVPYTSLQDTTFSNVLGRLINLHNNINKSIKTLQDTVKISQDVCNSQANGVGKCEY